MAKKDLQLDDYLTMDSRDLDKIVMHVKNILHLREKDMVQAIEQFDKQGLEHSLSMNQKITPKLLELMANSIVKLDINKTDFYEFIIQLDEVKKDNEIYTRLIEGMVRNSLYHTEFLDYVITKPELRNNLIKSIRYFTSLDDIDKLFKQGVIDLKQSPSFFDDMFKLNLHDYLQYGHDNQLFTVSEKKARQYFKEHYSDLSPLMITYLEQFGTGLENLTIGQLMLTQRDDPESNIIANGNDILKQGFREMMKGETPTFKFLIEHQVLDDVSVNQIMTHFNNLFHESKNPSALIEKLSILANEIYHNQHHLINHFEAAIHGMKQPKAKTAAKVILEQQMLNSVIAEKDSTKKVKI